MHIPASLPLSPLHDSQIKKTLKFIAKGDKRTKSDKANIFFFTHTIQ
jgi:hypothetical protein